MLERMGVRVGVRLGAQSPWLLQLPSA